MTLGVLIIAGVLGLSDGAPGPPPPAAAASCQKPPGRFVRIVAGWYRIPEAAEEGPSEKTEEVTGFIDYEETIRFLAYLERARLVLRGRQEQRLIELLEHATARRIVEPELDPMLVIGRFGELVKGDRVLRRLAEMERSLREQQLALVTLRDEQDAYFRGGRPPLMESWRNEVEEHIQAQVRAETEAERSDDN